MFDLNMVDYPVFFPLLSTLTWDNFLKLRNTWSLNLNHVLPPRHAKRPKSPLLFLLSFDMDFGPGLGLGLVNILSLI